MGNLDLSNYRYEGSGSFKLTDYRTDDTALLKSKKDAGKDLKKNIKTMAELQDKLYAQDKYAILIIIQAMDTAGKDGAIKHVMSGLNPQGTQVHSFKLPSAEELDHDYLWRANKYLPERGRIGIFNRSYYEEVLVVKVHDLLKKQQIPSEFITDKIWENRYRQIRDYESYLFENGIIPVKLFLNVSKEEQKNRLISRIDDASKNWKFSESDIKERGFWDVYQTCYQEAIAGTSTKFAPWFIIPADHKWFARLLISEIIIQKMGSLKLAYPSLTKDQHNALKHYKKLLLEE